MRDGESKARNEMREVREEVNNIRDMLPKVIRELGPISRSKYNLQMIEKNKESQTQSLAELQQELKSLKALLLSRGPNSIPSSPLPVLGKASIPAWQLASNSNEPSSSSPPVAVGSSVASLTKDKGKEVESGEGSQ